MSFITVGMMIAGLILLVLGAEGLVRGASRIAAFLNISPLIIGLTIVAYGTSAPEMAVSLLSNIRGQADIALGNVVGSNIFNVLMILGMSALVTPLIVSRQLIRIDVPIMIGVSILTLFLGRDGNVSRMEGGILFVFAIIYTGLQVFLARRENHNVTPAKSNNPYSGNTGNWWRQWGLNLCYIGFGLLLLVAGSHWLVNSAVTIAHWLGISELIIGLTIVAAGTSLPELATSVMAGIHGERDIAVGNVVGSNIFNILAVLGASAALSDSGVSVAEQARQFDIAVMIAAAAVCLPIFFTGHRISRWEGAFFIVYYGIYTAYLILLADRSFMKETIDIAVAAFLLPITLIVLSMSVYRSLRGGNDGNSI